MERQSAVQMSDDSMVFLKCVGNLKKCWDNFVQGWNVDYFDQWVNMYDEHPYGRGNDDHWKWDWQEAKEYYESIYGKDDNLKWLWNEAGDYYDA